MEVFCDVYGFCVSLLADEFVDDFDAVFLSGCLSEWGGFVGVCQFGQLAFVGWVFVIPLLRLLSLGLFFSVYGCLEVDRYA